MLQICPARSEDAEAAFDIRREAIRHQCASVYTNEQVMAWTSMSLTEGYRASVQALYHLAWQEGIAVATGFIDFESGEVGALFVRPDFMGQGIGQRMLDHLEQLARDAGLAEVHLEATLNAAAFYRRRGFVGDTQAVYQSPYGVQLACVPMRKPLLAQRDQTANTCPTVSET